MPEACNFIKKETLAQVISYEFSGISKNTFSTEHLQTTASVCCVSAKNCDCIVNTESPFPLIRRANCMSQKIFLFKLPIRLLEVVILQKTLLENLGVETRIILMFNLGLMSTTLQIPSWQV